MRCLDSSFTLRSFTPEACQVKEGKTKQNPDLNRIPFSLFIQVVSEFCSWRIPIFSSAMSSLQNAHLHGSKSVPFWEIISILL